MAEQYKSAGIKETRIQMEDFQPIIDAIEFQKSYLFKIILPYSIKVAQDKGNIIVSNPIQYCVSNTSFPTSTTANQAVAFFNSELKVASKTTYTDWSITFRCDTGSSGKTGNAVAYLGDIPLNTYEYFNYWRGCVFWELDRVSSLPKDYKRDFDLILLDERGEASKKFTIFGGWPAGITGGDLNYSTDSILTFNVAFTFDRFMFSNV